MTQSELARGVGTGGVGAERAQYHIDDRDAVCRRADEVRDHLGACAFDVAWAEGRALAPEQAVTYVLADVLPLLPYSST